MEKKTPQEILDELSNTEFRGDFEDTLDIACHPDTDIDRITTLVKSAMEIYAKQETERLQSENEKMRAEIAKEIEEYKKLSTTWSNVGLYSDSENALKRAEELETLLNPK